MSTLDRIRKLIALSGSANEHEARSAAFLDVAIPILAADASRGVAHADCRARWSVVDDR